MTSSSTSSEAAAEAARYALLRRLAPSMRHHLVVNLQPIGMVYEIMDRRLRAPEPNLAEVQDGAQKINGYARAALSSCLDVVTWLAPEEGAAMTVEQGTRECLELVGSSFSFRGFNLRSDIAGVPGKVSRGAFRNVVTGALVHLSDENQPPAEITVRAREVDKAVEVELDLRAKTGDPGFATAPTYRPITWADVEALAAADAVQVSRQGRTVKILLPVLEGS